MVAVVKAESDALRYERYGRPFEIFQLPHHLGRPEWRWMAGLKP